MQGLKKGRIVILDLNSESARVNTPCFRRLSVWFRLLPHWTNVRASRSCSVLGQENIRLRAKS
jgi:hypothetical protein